LASAWSPRWPWSLVCPNSATAPARPQVCWQGSPPPPDDSGQRTGERYIRGGRASVRCALYFAALTASRFNPPLAEDYNRLIAKGKEAKVAITALMRKIVVLANTLTPEDSPWQPIQP